jgi:2-aminoethylphosphonate-pyruvate transaminase
MMVDGVSAFGAEDIHVLRDHIDVLTSVGNKAVAGITGVAFVIARREAVPPLGPNMPRRNVYLNLQNHLKWAREHGQTPNTPAVTAMVALDQALKELLADGLDKRVARALTLSRMVRSGLRDMGLRFLLPEEQMSNTLTSAFLPLGIDVDAFIARLDEHGFVVYPGKGVWHDQNMFQVATMGTLTAEDTRALLKAIRDTIQELQRAAA